MKNRIVSAEDRIQNDFLRCVEDGTLTFIMLPNKSFLVVDFPFPSGITDSAIMAFTSERRARQYCSNVGLDGAIIRHFGSKKIMMDFLADMTIPGWICVDHPGESNVRSIMLVKKEDIHSMKMGDESYF
jgi:hypothetical protein